MDLQRALQRIFRIIFAYAGVGMILLICLCVGLWSAFETSLRVTNEAFQNIFQIRRNIPFIESDDETPKDELQTFPKSTNPPSGDTTSECASSPTFSGPTKTLKTTEEKATDKQTKSDRISTKEDFSNLEGLALQMVHLEQHRLSTDVPYRPSNSEICDRSPNESVPVNVVAPKSVLKSSCSENKPPTSTRGTRRIRFQDPPIYEVSKGSSDDFTSPKKPLKGSPLGSQQRKISPAAYLKSGLNFEESPAKSSGTKTRITEQSPEALPTEAPIIDLHSGIASNQQLANEETKPLAEESNSTIPTAFSSETTDKEQIANKSMDPLSEEFNSTTPTELSSETANSQQVANETVDSLSDELNPTNPLMLSSNIATNQQVSNESMDSLSEESSSTNSTQFSSETATQHQVTNESMDSTVPTTYKELEESPKVGDRCFETDREESTSTLKSDEISFLEQTSEEISNQTKEMKVDELRYESSVKEKTTSSDEKEESFKKGDTEDIRELPEKSEAESLQAMNLLSESSISQQSTKELINANLKESTSSDELNPTFLKTDEELCRSIESDLKNKLKIMESTGIADHKEASQERIAQTLNKMDVEKLSDDSSEREGMGHRPVKKKHPKKCKKGH